VQADNTHGLTQTRGQKAEEKTEIRGQTAESGWKAREELKAISVREKKSLQIHLYL
jgi:hypothetical protein